MPVPTYDVTEPTLRYLLRSGKPLILGTLRQYVGWLTTV